MEEKELEEKILTYRILQARLESLLKQRDLIIAKLVELKNTLTSIDEIQKSEDALFPIGSEAYTFGKIAKKERIIVEIGANIALEEKIEEGKRLLEKRKLEMESALNSIQREIVQIYSNLQQLGPKIEELAKKEK